MDFLYSLDVTLLRFMNHSLSNPVTDLLWPVITNWDKYWPVRILLLVLWVLLMVKGGTTGRTVAVLLVPLIFLSDQLSSALIKPLVNRPRPCHTVNGVQVVQDLLLLTGCGSGKSFPSSHAVNNFAVATLFAFFYRRWLWAFFTWASVVALSRPALGVHYPSDVLGGALLGMVLAWLLIHGWLKLQHRYFPKLNPSILRSRPRVVSPAQSYPDN